MIPLLLDEDQLKLLIAGLELYSTKNHDETETKYQLLKLMRELTKEK